mmetsp:Transcript_61975/g.157609  ORF Transcript_61975/g.157609 Transcript_61975/m.157609 type:complete len:377 (+) Transcript_61975:427-1557(+)
MAPFAPEPLAPHKERSNLSDKRGMPRLLLLVLQVQLFLDVRGLIHVVGIAGAVGLRGLLGGREPAELAGGQVPLRDVRLLAVLVVAGVATGPAVQVQSLSPCLEKSTHPGAAVLMPPPETAEPQAGKGGTQPQPEPSASFSPYPSSPMKRLAPAAQQSISPRLEKSIHPVAAGPLPPAMMESTETSTTAASARPSASKAATRAAPNKLNSRQEVASASASKPLKNALPSTTSEPPTISTPDEVEAFLSMSLSVSLACSTTTSDSSSPEPVRAVCMVSSASRKAASKPGSGCAAAWRPLARPTTRLAKSPCPRALSKRCNSTALLSLRPMATDAVSNMSAYSSMSPLSAPCCTQNRKHAEMARCSNRRTTRSGEPPP